VNIDFGRTPCTGGAYSAPQAPGGEGASALAVPSKDTDTDTDILADILARIVARMSACRSACHSKTSCRKSLARVGRVGEDTREDVRVGVGVVEFQLYTYVLGTGRLVSPTLVLQILHQPRPPSQKLIQRTVKLGVVVVVQ